MSEISPERIALRVQPPCAGNNVSKAQMSGEEHLDGGKVPNLEQTSISKLADLITF